MTRLIRRRRITNTPVFAIYRWAKLYNYTFRVYMDAGEIYLDAWTRA